MNDLEKEIISIAEGLDETLNALAGSLKDIPAAGNPHYTLSQRWAYERAAGPLIMGNFAYRKACFICNILTIVFKPFFSKDSNYDHCSEAIADFPPNLSSEG